MNKRSLDNIVCKDELKQWATVLGRQDIQRSSPGDDTIELIEDATKDFTIFTYFGKVIQSRALLQAGVSDYGCGFDELPAPTLSMALGCQRVRELLQANIEERQIKVDEARRREIEISGIAAVDLDMKTAFLPQQGGKHFKNLDDSLEGNVAADNWTRTRR